jgi:hypothetical protein
LVVFVGGESDKRRGVGQPYAVIAGEDRSVKPRPLAHGLMRRAEAKK